MAGVTLRCVAAVVAAIAGGFEQKATTPPPATSNCVSIGTPKPGVGYTYSHVESTGNSSEYTQYWDRLTPTESRVRIVKAGQDLVQTSIYKVVDDVAHITRMTKAGGGRVIDSTTFNPGLVSDPIFRACAGKSWAVPSVALVFDGPTSARANTPAGRLSIVAIRGTQTVPAGTFDTVEYVRTSQSRDVYWKSTLHGVIVKHIASVAGNSVTETLIRIK